MLLCIIGVIGIVVIFARIIISIFFIAFFFEVFKEDIIEVSEEDIIYVGSIQCDSIALYDGDSTEILPNLYIDDVPHFVFDFIPPADGNEYTADDESILINPNIIQLNFDVLPHLADKTEVRFEFDESDKENVVYHEESQSFVFLKAGEYFKITIRAVDGSNVSTQVSIKGEIPKN